MKSFAILAVFLLIIIGFYVLIRNDFDEKHRLTKKGYIKLMTAMGIVFIMIMLFVTYIESMSF